MFNKMQTDNNNNDGQCHNQWKEHSEKNGFKVSQNSILCIFCYKT